MNNHAIAKHLAGRIEELNAEIEDLKADRKQLIEDAEFWFGRSKFWRWKYSSHESESIQKRKNQKPSIHPMENHIKLVHSS